jgi:hypothetical protein
MFTSHHFYAFICWIVSEEPVMRRDESSGGASMRQDGRDVDISGIRFACKDFYHLFMRWRDRIYSCIGTQKLYIGGIATRCYRTVYHGEHTLFKWVATARNVWWIQVLKPSDDGLSGWRQVHLDRVSEPLFPSLIEIEGTSVSPRDFIRKYCVKLILNGVGP